MNDRVAIPSTDQVVIHARWALLPTGWARDVAITIRDGAIESVKPGGTAMNAAHDLVIAGIPNLHSHAFQRAMAGLAERRGPAADSFWTWRETMYRFALAMTPDDVEAVAAQLQVEMLEAGFTRVGEFHYLHHDHDGRPFADPAEMAARIATAASDTGIRLTLLPVLYAHAGFGGTDPDPGQRRFICTPDQFSALWDASCSVVARLPGSSIGVAPHSLRAVTPGELAAVLDLAPDLRVHIHVAEQQREVDDCLAWSGQRPVAWLLDHAPVNERWCLIHATHIDADESRRLAATGATVGLCPVTEANLGDGIFPAPEYVAAGGRFGIGTDSNVQVSVTDELRQLEYSQRLARQQRNVLAGPHASTGRSLVEAVTRGGAAALGAPGDGIAPGAPADLVSLRAATWIGDDPDTMLDAWIFATGIEVSTVWVAGEPVVEDGRHRHRERIAGRFRVTMRTLLTRI